MIKKMVLILLSLMTILAFAGCQLAEEGKGTASNADVLCGMFITFEPLYSEENCFDNIDWGAVLSGGQQMYQTERKPLYAAERISPEFGAKDYYFEDRDGIRLMEVLGIATDITRFFTYHKGEFYEFFPEREDTMRWLLLTEELHRSNGGKWR